MINVDSSATLKPFEKIDYKKSRKHLLSSQVRNRSSFNMHNRVNKSGVFSKGVQEDRASPSNEDGKDTQFKTTVNEESQVDQRYGMNEKRIFSSQTR